MSSTSLVRSGVFSRSARTTSAGGIPSATKRHFVGEAVTCRRERGRGDDKDGDPRVPGARRSRCARRGAPAAGRATGRSAISAGTLSKPARRRRRRGRSLTSARGSRRGLAPRPTRKAAASSPEREGGASKMSRRGASVRASHGQHLTVMSSLLLKSGDRACRTMQALSPRSISSLKWSSS